jgi:hypothetical protein
MFMLSAARRFVSSTPIRQRAFAASVSEEGTHPDFQPKKKQSVDAEAEKTHSFIAQVFVVVVVVSSSMA